MLSIVFLPTILQQITSGQREKQIGEEMTRRKGQRGEGYFPVTESPSQICDAKEPDFGDKLRENYCVL